MNMKILLPFRIFAQFENVRRIVFETGKGSYGMLPMRLDCVASLVPGILTYEIDGKGEQYIAIDEGLLVKAGAEVIISVRNAIGGADLGKLRESVERDILNLDEQEKNVRSVMAKMESSFVYSLHKLQKE